MADITVTYNGQQIASLSDSGTTTLTTAGKYCDGNVLIEYVKPSPVTITCSSWYLDANNILTMN